MIDYSRDACVSAFMNREFLTIYATTVPFRSIPDPQCRVFWLAPDAAAEDIGTVLLAALAESRVIPCGASIEEFVSQTHAEADRWEQQALARCIP
jgi:hypothetical protein